jgi:hypothetical protein
MDRETIGGNSIHADQLGKLGAGLSRPGERGDIKRLVGACLPSLVNVSIVDLKKSAMARWAFFVHK